MGLQPGYGFYLFEMFYNQSLDYRVARVPGASAAEIPVRHVGKVETFEQQKILSIKA